MLDAFLTRWQNAGPAERANKDMFCLELCDALGVPRPQPKQADPQLDAYVLEADAVLTHASRRNSVGKMDLYRKGAFILEAKQGSQAGALVAGTARRSSPAWNIAMRDAFGQALSYARSLAEPPPFLICCDIGHCFDLYATFDGTWDYRPFPDPQSSRIWFADLSQHADLLRAIWLDPMSLDPARRKARVTTEIAAHLADLARSLERRNHPPEQVARFLMRCLFTMFAEDVGLLPHDVFTDALHKHWLHQPARFAPEVQSLWELMDRGGFSIGLGRILRFNGGLFADPVALPLTRPDLETLLAAARCSWEDVEPAIFGTLLERALDPRERHKLGAHYTPRPYVERLIKPTLEDPLREEWDAVRAAARQLVNANKVEDAREEVGSFHRSLCDLRVLDPACGTGNFLYVALDLVKRLEAEVVALLVELGDTQIMFGRRVTPRQFLGIEVKPWAREIADLVLWVGYLSAQVRLLGKDRQMAEPILEKLDNIQCRDAVLAWDTIEPVLAEDGQPLYRWDGVTTKKHLVTGEDVPDDTARVPVVRYTNPRPAEWPAADFVVGNPPFIGGWKIRQARGDGYVEALWVAYPDVPEKADYVMYWWEHAARLVRANKLRRFGFITTNSIHQTFQRRVLQTHMEADDPVSLVFAIPDHPWVDSASAADVRIAMTVAEAGRVDGVLCRVQQEEEGPDAARVELCTQRGRIHANLRIGADITRALPLRANANVSSPGVQLYGAGFIVTPAEAAALGLGRVPGLEQYILPYRNGRDLTATPRGVMVIDLFGLSADDVQARFPEVYQWVYERVKPERDHNQRISIRQKWWRLGWERPALRMMLSDISRYIATVETAKHRVFQFLDAGIRPDNKLVCVGMSDAFFLGVLSSRIHVVWALAAGGRLGVGNDPIYTKSRCFDPFPFPAATPAQVTRIRDLGERLDAHRKARQALHPTLTLTGMYNALEQLRAGVPFDDKARAIHDQGLISILRQLHDDLDAAVADAYGWPVDMDEEAILERLVALNAARAAEEQRGEVRWLRPDFQAKGVVTQTGLISAEDDAPVTSSPAKKQDWPKLLRDRITAVRALLQDAHLSVDDVVARFKGARRKDVEAILDSLTALGLV